jgi:hypothetical protein
MVVRILGLKDNLKVEPVALASDGVITACSYTCRRSCMGVGPSLVLDL